MIMSFSYKLDKSMAISAHFSVGEFASKSGSKLYSDSVLIDDALIAVLEKLFTRLNCSKIVITSGYRTAAHDKAVGGDGKGYHTKGMAADINCWRVVNGKESRFHGSEICCALQDIGWAHGIGWIAGAAVHIDSRTTQYWFDEQNCCRSIGKDWYAYFAKKGYIVPKPGDVDGDGAVTTTDARLILQEAAGKSEKPFTERQKAAADVDGDGKVTTTDARLTLQNAAGKQVK